MFRALTRPAPVKPDYLRHGDVTTAYLRVENRFHLHKIPVLYTFAWLPRCKVSLIALALAMRYQQSADSNGSQASGLTKKTVTLRLAGLVILQ